MDFDLTNLTNYTASALVDGVHKLPHLDFKLEAVPADFSIEQRPYLASLAVCGIFWVALSLIGMLIICCSGYKGSNYVRIGPPRLKCTTVTLVLLGIFGSGALALGVFSRFLIQDGFEDIQQHWNESRTDIVNFFDTIASTDDNLNTVNMQLTRARNELPTNVYNEIKSQISSVEDELSDVLQYRNTLNSSMIPENILSYSYIDYVDSGFIALAGLMMLTIHLVVISRWCCKRKTCGSCCCSASATIVFFLGMVMTGMFFAISVGLSDFCANATVATTTLLTEMECSDDVVTTAGFYINCPPDGTMVYLTEVEQSLQYIQNGIVTIQQLNNPSNEIVRLERDLVTLNTTTSGLYTEMMCGEIHSQYVGTVEGVCTNVFYGIWSIFCAMGVSSLMLAISVCLFQKVRKAQKTEQMGVEDWELVQPREYRLSENIAALRRRQPVYEDTAYEETRPTAPLLLPSEQTTHTHRTVEQLTASMTVPWGSMQNTASTPTQAYRSHTRNPFVVQSGSEEQDDAGAPPAYYPSLPSF
eukprot:m.155322 g.155322  ORF g.155322 m.155322 type:complete len:529 (-) comp30933_c0_seq1:27-1613(-)